VGFVDTGHIVLSQRESEDCCFQKFYTYVGDCDLKQPWKFQDCRPLCILATQSQVQRRRALTAIPRRWVWRRVSRRRQWGTSSSESVKDAGYALAGRKSRARPVAVIKTVEAPSVAEVSGAGSQVVLFPAQQSQAPAYSSQG
jgi:hypothetical protein